ncbi:MAG: hypothetical protein AAGF53_17345 [Pseudomonadota bacterium]
MGEAENIHPRDPNLVMRLDRLGSFHQSRLSFMRQLLRRLVREKWRFEQTVFDFDENGVGHAVYTAHGPERSYSLVAFGNDLPPEKRSDRVIATEWDTAFTLFDGVPEQNDIDRLRSNVPKQEAGRVSENELTLSRANRSVRLWEHVVERLSQGAQPDIEKVIDVGYLMRTTAVYGSGKFGAADRAQIAERAEFQAPFQVEMLTVYLIRTFVMDLVEHMARKRAPETAVPLDPELRRNFGIGNSTGLGMAPFLINHPALLNAWVGVREEALCRVRQVVHAQPQDITTINTLLARAILHAAHWHSEHPAQISKLRDLRADLEKLQQHLHDFVATGALPWNALWLWVEENLSLEGQEQCASLLIELYPELVDPLTACMSTDEQMTFPIDGSMRLSRLREIVEDIYGWALKTDWAQVDAKARVWYTSEAKLEPRLGERFEEPLEPYEQPLGPGRDAALLYQALVDSHHHTVAAFLLEHPEHRHIARRAQIAARLPYAEIRDNTISAEMMPIDMLRMKLSFFGACHFDPRSDRWVRINMFQHAPFPHELCAETSDSWTLPPLPIAAQ